MDHLARDVIAIADNFGIPVFDVVGQSMGSLVTQYLMVHYAERVGRAILLNSGVARSNPAVRAAFEDGTLDHPVAAVSRLEPAERIRRVGPSLFSAAFVATPAYAEWICWQEPLAADADTIRAYLRAAIECDLSALISGARQPTLVIAGSEDSIAPPEGARELAALIPGAEYVELTGGHHGMLYERPDWIAQQLTRFLNDGK